MLPQPFLFFGSPVNGRNANAASQNYSHHPKAALGRKLTLHEAGYIVPCLAGPATPPSN